MARRLSALWRSLTVGLGTLIICGCVAASQASVDWKLSSEAQATFAILLLDVSIRENNPAGIHEAVDTLLQSNPHPRPVLEAGVWFLMNGDPGSAAAILERGLVAFPDSMSLHLLLAESYLESNSAQKAVTLMQSFTAKHNVSSNDSLIAKQELGIIYLKANMPLEALQTLNSLPQKTKSAQTRYQIAIAHNMLAQYSEAVDELEQSLKIIPDFYEAWLELGKAYEGMNMFTKAGDTYRHALELDPEYLEARSRLIDIELRLGNVPKALTLIDESSAQSGFLLTAATQLIRNNLYDEAEDVLLNVKQDPSAPEEVAFYLAAIAYERDKNLAATLEHLRSISEANTYYDRAAKFQIQILVEMGRLKQAQDLALQLLNRNSDEREYPFIVSQLYTLEENWQKALETIQNALALWPNDAELHYTKGSLLDIMGRKDEAMAYMSDLVKQFPDNYQILNYVGYMLADQNRELEQALSMLEKAHRLAPTKAYILDSLAWAQYRLKQYDKALDNIRRAVNLPESQEATIWDHYGDIAKANQLLDEARKAWVKALSLEPDDPTAIHRKLRALP